MDTNIIIRRMTLEDYEKVYALWLSCSGIGLNDINDSKEGIDSFLKRNPETCFVAESKGEAIGVILCGNDGRRGYIYHLAVKPSFRRKGIASSLVEAALDSLRRLGIIKAALLAFGRNKEGNDFWEKQGFTVREDLCYRNKALIDYPHRY